MKEYTYVKNWNENNPPDLCAKQTDILNSTLTNKNIKWMRWDGDTKILTIAFADSLSTEDEAILTNIVTQDNF